MDRARLESLLQNIVRAKASSLHLVSDQRPCFRLQGALVMSESDPISARALDELAQEFLFADHRAALRAGRDVSFLYTSQDGVRFRTTVFSHANGLSVEFRPIPTAAPTIEDLGLPQLVRGFIEFRSGIVLLGGFFGSGKSTTMASLVQEAALTGDRQIVTIEDSIDYVYTNARVPVHQRQVGTHVDTFGQGIDDARRHCARMIVVNELKDWQAVDAVLSAAESGALVLATVHASNLVSTLAETIALYPLEERSRARVRLATNLRSVASQSLIRRRHNQGRVPLLEVMINTPAVARALRAGKLQELPQIIRNGRGLGMQTIDAALRTLLQQNLISEEEALSHASDRDFVVTRRPAAQRPPQR